MPLYKTAETDEASNSEAAAAGTADATTVTDPNATIMATARRSTRLIVLPSSMRPQNDTCARRTRRTFPVYGPAPSRAHGPHAATVIRALMVAHWSSVIVRLYCHFTATYIFRKSQ